MKTIKMNNCLEVPKNFTGIVEYLYGTKEWWVNGKLHREDGPAIEESDGTKFWYKEGSLHRLDGPAIEYVDKHKEWRKEGKLHRLDGPAVEYANGYKEWWIEGVEYSREKLKTLTDTSVFLEIERGRFNLEWIKYLTETGIQEYPIIPGTTLHFARQIFKEKKGR